MLPVPRTNEGQMATVERRKSHGKTVYYAKVRIKGQAQSATFHSLSEARKWSQQVEAEILDGRRVPTHYTLFHHRTLFFY